MGQKYACNACLLDRELFVEFSENAWVYSSYDSISAQMYIAMNAVNKSANFIRIIVYLTEEQIRRVFDDN